MATGEHSRKETFGAVLHRLCIALVLVGGLLLCCVAVLTVVSIIGRALTGFGLGPVPGDFELAEIGVAVAVFFFLPWCQLNRGHVTVDILVNTFPNRAQRFFELLGNIGISLIAIVVLWRLWMGMGERVSWFGPSLRSLLGFGMKPFSVETTFILGMPVWYGYALAVIGAALFCVVALYTVWLSVLDCLSGSHSGKDSGKTSAIADNPHSEPREPV